MKTIKMFPCTQIELYTVSAQAWAYCLENLALFAAIKPKYTPEFVAAIIEEIAAVTRMPNSSQRRAGQIILRMALKQESEKVILTWKKLRRYIIEA